MNVFSQLNHPNKDVRVAVIGALGSVAIRDDFTVMDGGSTDDSESRKEFQTDGYASLRVPKLAISSLSKDSDEPTSQIRLKLPLPLRILCLLNLLPALRDCLMMMTYN